MSLFEELPRRPPELELAGQVVGTATHLPGTYLIS
jgi:hypothetical protein